MYLQFNNTTNAYLQCCRLPMLQPNKWLPAAMLLPILQSANNAAGSLCCLITTMQHAPYAALLVQCCRLSTVAIPHCKWLSTAMLLPSKWLPTMLHEAPSMLRLPTCGSLYAAPMLLAVKLPAVNCPPNNCQPSLPTEKAACRSCCLPTYRTLYTAAVRPRLYCRLTGPVQPITARRLFASAAAQPMRPLPLCTCKQLERYSFTN
jgi:hypothetical protein